ncbi:MAG: L-serine ammonia-lyase, iron-sulfur-dependent subunit beta [Gemmatimonadota bacterium]
MTQLFDVLGPRMVGPSSSHTAGACRLGYVVQGLLGGTPDRVEVALHGSFAMTGEGHGTKKAIVGGLLGYRPSDVRIRDSADRAEQAGLDVTFESVDLGDDVHPNSVVFRARRGEEEVEVFGSSVGGGQIRVWRIDGFDVDFSGALPTLVIDADDVPGTVAKITGMLADRNVNLATVRVDRTARGERALMTIECDEEVPPELVEEIGRQPWAHWIRYLRGFAED